MAELNVRFDLAFGTRSLRCLMAGAMLFAAAPELASESVTLTTYYPAPSGVYAQLITTGNTYLARDSGDVGIGTLTPGNKLQIAGSGGSVVDLNVNGRIQTGDTGKSGGIWLSNAGNMFVGQNGTNVGFWTATAGFNAFQVTQAGNVGIGTQSPSQLLEVSGNAQVDQNLTVTQNATITGNLTAGYVVSNANGVSGCAETSYQIDGYSPCPSNTYATLTSGVIANKTLMPAYEATANIGNGVGTALMLCCSCPGTGCPHLP